MQLDPAEFLHHVEGFDMSHEAKLELIGTVLHIAAYFTDLGWGRTPEQTALWISDTNRPALSSNAVVSAHPISPIFNGAAETAETDSR